MDCILEMHGAISRASPWMDCILEMHGAISRASPGMDILIMRAGNAQAISRLGP